MMRRLLAALLLLLPLSARASPEPVDRAANGFIAECREAGGKPARVTDFETAVDLNGDGQPDYILDGNRSCAAGGMRPTCGASGGCLAEIYVSGPSGYRRAFQDNVLGFTIDRKTQPPALIVNWHGYHCNRSGVEGCQQRMTWNGQTFAVGGVPARPPAAAASPSVMPAVGWGLRPVAGQSPQASVEGQGLLLNVTLSCVQGTPYATVTVRQRLQATGGVLLAVADGNRLELSARWTPQYPQVYVFDLTGSALPNLLMSAGGSLALSLNGSSLGAVPLTGAAASIRTALSPCLGR